MANNQRLDLFPVQLTERQFVNLLRKKAARSSRPPAGFLLRQGIGDDCAVIAWRRTSDLLVTTDTFLERVHFRREWQEPASLGHKALARGLSDIAAMGGDPRFAFLSLAFAPHIERSWLEAFLRGFLRLADQFDVVLAGGDTARSLQGVLADVFVVGNVPRRQAVLRSTARPGDEIWVTGQLGGAAWALATLKSRKPLPRGSQARQALFYPQPRLGIGRTLRVRKLASAMMDLSDGLSLDLARLCEESRVGACLTEDSIPKAPQASVELALHGGEDLELLFTVPQDRAARLPRAIGGVPLTRIGEIIRGRRLWLMRGGRKEPLPIRGYQHF